MARMRPAVRVVDLRRLELLAVLAPCADTSALIVSVRSNVRG